ncbi:type II toxin-antitoxin system VapC family toxin [Carboxydothermus ferrireducens]|uniref:Nucleic acid-binding protein n=1 Tax=Carboxydothermus ferrireducens DSM 11255 TaxID=1119529 RepID=A0ABX2RFN2_9THEO|nr:type II toxin-antitoxin system VapC family toxin [Carboxydothermus ferrireducens]NYE58628.1 putative nucleic acid-binding protein [Carboxydothermus ferrireducens DSM 11255]
MILIDSCGWLEFLADGPLAEDYAPYFNKPEEIITPTIVIYEVTKKIWREQGKEKALLVSAQMQQTKVVPFDISLALGAAEIALRFGLPMADAIVLATGSAYNYQVVTSDQHFKDLPGVIFIPKN